MAIDRRLLNGLVTVGALAAAYGWSDGAARSGSGHTLHIPLRYGADPKEQSVRFVGTATTLLRLGGFTLLTDPNFIHAGDHLHVGYGQVTRRLTDPAMEIHELPALDAVLLSHMHADHFDAVAERELDRSLPIVTTEHAARRLSKKGFREPYALRTWETMTLSRGDERLRITALPARHGPGPVNLMLPPVMGSLLDLETLDGQRRLRLYITGDTLMHEGIEEIGRRYPDIDAAIVHLGGTIVFGFLMVTMDDRQGVELLNAVRPAKAIPVHYDDYDIFRSPVGAFERAARAAGFGDRLMRVARGEKRPLSGRSSARPEPHPAATRA